MPMTTPVLLRALVDDAAVFPPGNAALADAVTGHAVHRSAPYAGCVGPLLVPAASVADLVRVLDERDAGCRARPAPPSSSCSSPGPGADPATVTAAVDALRRRRPGARRRRRAGWYDGWYEALAGRRPARRGEPRGARRRPGIRRGRTAHREGSPRSAEAAHRPHARPGPGPTRPRSAAFLRLVRARGAVQATGGLHHAVRGTLRGGRRPRGEPRGAQRARRDLRRARRGRSGRGHRPARPCATPPRWPTWSPPGPTTRQPAVREAFTAYGCCTVTDPVGELADLGLLPRP